MEDDNRGMCEKCKYIDCRCEKIDWQGKYWAQVNQIECLEYDNKGYKLLTQALKQEIEALKKRHHLAAV